MPVNKVAENVFATMGTICWTLQLVPQIYKSWRTKDVEGMSPYIVLLWGLAGGPLGTYVLVQKLSVPLIVQPQLFAVLCLTSWGQVLYYSRRRSKRAATLIALLTMATLGILEFIMVLSLRLAYLPSSQRRHVLAYTQVNALGQTQPGVLFFGVLSAVVISSALFPQYYEIWVYREVKGISKLFVFVDCLGGVFSCVSLVFKESLDVLASITYISVAVLDAVILVLAAILNPLARRRRRRRAAEEEAEKALAATATPSSVVSRASGERSRTATVEALEGPGERDRDLEKRAEVGG